MTMPSARAGDLNRFYEALALLESRIGGARKLADCNGRMGWPTRGVYFFFEPNQIRAESEHGPRVVRVGAHALTSRSGTSLWNRLSQHRGLASTGGGNHRGSIFRLLVGKALMARDPGCAVRTWASDSSAPRHVRDAEQELERRVSRVIRDMPVLWLEVDDPPGPKSRRGYIERNAIALLSNYDRTALDPPSRDWLGSNCPHEKVRRSGLWNQQHVDERYDPAFLAVLESLVSGRTDPVPPSMSQADRIREFALAHYVETARASGSTGLTISAGELSRDMGLPNRMPNVCSALGSRKFLDMAGLRILERSGPPQGGSTTFHYAIGAPASAAPATPSPSRAAAPHREELPHDTFPATQRGEKPGMTVVIQCAAGKRPSAGHLITRNGQRVMFVADPTKAPTNTSLVYQRPDDAVQSGVTWREKLQEYNRNSMDNPLGLLPAWQLYRNPVYADLVGAFGLQNVYILSAGWGLVAAEFLTPNYDITFSTAPNVDIYKRRRQGDRHDDFSMLPKHAAEPIVFLGGKDYVPLFCSLTAHSGKERIVFYNAGRSPNAQNCRLVLYFSPTRINWHYECAKSLINADGWKPLILGHS